MLFHMRLQRRLRHATGLAASLALAVLTAAFQGQAWATDLVVSAQDGKFARVDGASTYPQPAPPDSLAVIDMEQKPPKLVALIEGVAQTVQGPPQAVAITPDGSLAIVSAPSHFDAGAKLHILDSYVQIVDLTAKPPVLGPKIEIGVQPNGLAINPAGTLALAAAVDGTLFVFTIQGKTVALKEAIKVSDGVLASASFTPDGRAAIVTQREKSGAAVLEVDGDKVTLTKERISTGVAPYAVDTDAKGKWAVIGNAGLAGLPGQNSPGDADSFTLVDISKRPFRAVSYGVVPATPEDVAISPDGHWIVAQSLAGSNLPKSSNGWGKSGIVSLFSVDEAGTVKLVNQVPSGLAAQGIVFGKDSRTILVQNDVDKNLGIYDIEDGKLVNTGNTIPLAAGPVGIRSMPRAIAK